VFLLQCSFDRNMILEVKYLCALLKLGICICIDVLVIDQYMCEGLTHRLMDLLLRL